MSLTLDETEPSTKQPTSPKRTMPEQPDISGDGRHVILCCDCEGTEEQLGRMFDAIQDAEVAANFFFVGETAETYPELVREISTFHQSESHTYSHPNLRKLTRGQQRQEILKGKEVVESVIGRPTHGFRAPMHHINLATVEILNEGGFAFDASRLYFRYNMGGVEELNPTWWREWMPLYGNVGISPRRAFSWFLKLSKWRRLSVLPAHPHYAGFDEKMAEAFNWYLRTAKDQGVQFWYADDYLAEFRGLKRPEWRPEFAHESPVPLKKA